MWKLKHWLFGWHYVHMENSVTEIIRNVRTTPAGERYVIYFMSNLVFIDRDKNWTISPLTWREPPKQEIRRVA